MSRPSDDQNPHLGADSEAARAFLRRLLADRDLTAEELWGRIHVAFGIADHWPPCRRTSDAIKLALQGATETEIVNLTGEVARLDRGVAS